MGTPEFAVPSLDILVKNNYNVVAVITAPDKPAGRGQKLVESEVKKYAVANGLEVLQPTNLKDADFIEQLRGFKADLQIVVAFRMLPEVVWAMPPKGTFNLHGSLLPQYRGAAPINWAVINGETETGVTTFMLKHEIDTGSIIMQDREIIAPEDTVGTLYERLMHKGAQLVLKTVRSIESNSYQLLPQDNSKELKHAPKIFKETCQLDFKKSATENHNLVRGLSPYPGAYFLYQAKSYKVYKTEIVTGVVDTKELLTDDKTFVYLRCLGGTYLSVLEIQPEGKKRMGIEDFLRGNKI